MSGAINICGAGQYKRERLDIPIGAPPMVTGPTGSGKSSRVLDYP